MWGTVQRRAEFYFMLLARNISKSLASTKTNTKQIYI